MYIYPHNPAWKELFLTERKKILQAVNIKPQLYHIGSTAVAGMFAKNCIDMLGVVDQIEAVDSIREDLEELGYECRGAYGIVGRVYFSKPAGPKCHLHVFQLGDVNISRHLAFINKMNANPKLVEEFNRIKIKLQALYPDDKNRYQQEKVFFYENLLN